MSRTRGLTHTLIFALTLALAGCGQTLFPDRTPRSPYDRYADLRGQAAPETERNRYGVEQPALRKRLQPFDP